MDPFWIVTLVVSVLLIGYLISIYNHLVRLKHQVTQSWANIDVLLKQRHDELPKLVDSCKQHMSYESETLQAVIQARSAVSSARETGDVKALGAAETLLRRGLGSLFAVAEDYPELRASDSFMHLQVRITGLENDIADRREFYNDSVNALNTRIEQFPDLLVARRLGFNAAALLQFDAAELKDHSIKTLFK